MDVAGDLGGLRRQQAQARASRFRLGAGGHRVDLDGQRREPLREVVVQLARDPLPLELLAGDQAAGQVAVERGCPLHLRDVPNDAEQAIGTHPHDARLEVLPLVHRQLVFDDDRLVALVGLAERRRHRLAYRRGQDIRYVASEECLWGHEQQSRIARVVFDDRAVAQENEHQIGQRPENRPVARLGAVLRHRRRG
jgi:hypothetical protein